MELQEMYPELLRTLREAGLDPDRLEPWPTWKAFKQYLRQPGVLAEHAAYVEFGVNQEGDDFWHLRLVVQAAAWEAKLTEPTVHPDDQGVTPELNVVREIVIDLAYEASDLFQGNPQELARGDFNTLGDFMAAVESESNFQAAMAAECVGSLVYEEEA